MSKPACDVNLTHATHRDDGAGVQRPLLIWTFGRPMRSISSAVVGGGIQNCGWVLNAEVTQAYHRSDPAEHVREIAAECGLSPAGGSGLLTAASVEAVRTGRDEGVRCDATVGLSFPTWAAEFPTSEPPVVRWRPGTINLVCVLPVALCDAALVNAVVTATEAKTQALVEAGVPGSGTASDAIVICCPTEGELEAYAGPRSLWGARLARAVHAAVAAGVAGYGERSKAR